MHHKCRISISIQCATHYKYLLFVKVDSVVMHATSITTTSRMLSVFACWNTKRVSSEILKYETYYNEKFYEHRKIRLFILTNTTMSVTNMSSELPGLGLLGRLFERFRNYTFAVTSHSWMSEYSPLRTKADCIQPTTQDQFF